MTEEQELLLDAWNQFAGYTDEKGNQKWWHNGLSTLEAIHEYLLRKELINVNGEPK